MGSKQKLTSQTIIYLLRNDLRLHDNECFNYISKLAEEVKSANARENGHSLRLVPLYCFQPEHYLTGTYNFGFSRIGQPRARFLLETVKDLKQQLQNRGSNLIVKSCFTDKSKSSPIHAVQTIIEQLREGNGGSLDQQYFTLVFHQEATQEEMDEERSLINLCKKQGINFKTFWGSSLYHKDDLPFNKIRRNESQIPDVPDVYTEFRKSVENKAKVRPPFQAPASLPPLPSNIESDEMPCDINVFGSLKTNSVEPGSSSVNKSAFPFKGGETTALDRLHEYLWGSNAIVTYKETRNGLVGTQYSTKFSPWLANGSLSPRYIYAQVKKFESSKVANQSTYWVIFELIWRDFFRFVCLKYGNKVFQAGGIRGHNVAWKQDLSLFDRWRKGTTGVPFIDANMRELLETGWMSNRGRQNVASFLVKDLKLDWRLGAEWFESMLLDHDVCSNYGNWNYAAGIGNDPREDRKFNVIKQGLDYDPNGDFVKLWVPELSKLLEQTSITKGSIHCPWKVKLPDLNKANIKLGTSYPKPMVVAGEWDRHYNKLTSQKGGAPGRQGQQRGVDFYFKPANKSKNN